MGLALHLYANDFQDYYPSVVYDRTGAKQIWPWERAIEPYYVINWTNAGYHCPGFKGIITNSLGGLTNVYSGSYAYNAYGFIVTSGTLGLSSPWSSLTAQPRVRASDVDSPSEMFAIGESRLPSSPAPDVGLLYPTAPLDYMVTEVFATSTTAQYRLQVRHGRTYNQLCCDGHVDIIAPAALYRETQVARRWNRDHQLHMEQWTP